MGNGGIGSVADQFAQCVGRHTSVPLGLEGKPLADARRAVLPDQDVPDQQCQAGEERDRGEADQEVGDKEPHPDPVGEFAPEPPNRPECER